VTAVAVALGIGTGSPAGAAIARPVELGTASQYSVLAGSAVTNTGDSVLNGSVGLASADPDTITGFPPGVVLPPSTIHAVNAPEPAQAQTDLTAAYDFAAGQPVDAEVPAGLAGQTLLAGVHAASSKSALILDGRLILDGANDPSSVFIIQTDSTLTTLSGSTVELTRGAQACNVFWVIGSSATLGTNSLFAGNILALTSITVTTGAVVEGRALARNGAVTLDTNTFTAPGCATTPTTTTTAGTGETTSTVAGGVTTTPGAIAGETTTTGGFVTSTLSVASTSPIPTFPDVTLPRTGSSGASRSAAVFALLALLGGVGATRLARRSAPSNR
jgi:hypothetical protein